MKPLFLTLGMTIALLNTSCKKSESCNEMKRATVEIGCFRSLITFDNKFYSVSNPNFFNDKSHHQTIHINYRVLKYYTTSKNGINGHIKILEMCE